MLVPHVAAATPSVEPGGASTSISGSASHSNMEMGAARGVNVEEALAVHAITAESLQQGFVQIEPGHGSETPPPLVGATLTCLEVSLQDNLLGSQLGLYLFGGDDQDGRQSDVLYVYYVQEKWWKRPQTRNRAPAKRSRHTASVVRGKQRQQLLIFGGVGATNAISLLDPLTVEWSHPAAISKPGEKEKAKRRAQKSKASDAAVSESLLPCARFGHSVAVVDRRLLLFGGAAFSGPLGDLYELDMAKEPMEWSRPDTTGYAPPPSVQHDCAVVRDHMLLISGENEWAGHMWALKLQPSLVWFRSTSGDFPLLGASRFAIQLYATPRPHRRSEIFVFGGHLEAVGGMDSEVLDAFVTLDLRGWRLEEAEVPREVWKDLEKKLLAAGKEDKEIAEARADWEEEQKRKQKQILRANRRKARRGRLLGRRGKEGKEGKEGKDKEGEGSASGVSGDEEEISDEEELARREAEKEFELPPEQMPTITFGEFVPLRVGSRLPPPRFGHAMAMAGNVAYVFGGRNRSMKEPVMNDLHAFDGTPLAWQAVSYDGDGPGKRVSHTVVRLDQYLYSLGGGCGNRSFNDVHRLDLFTMHWELVQTRGAVPGAKPDALVGHSVAWVEPFLVVFAGGDGRRPCNDLHTLELRTGTWRRIDTSGAPPAPRVGHSSTLDGAEMYITCGFSRGKYFRDVHMLQVEQLQWTQVVTSGTAPHGRVSHTATLYEGAIHIFGGSAGKICFNDYLVLTPQNRKTGAAGGSGGGGGSSALALAKKPTDPSRVNAQWSSPEVAGFPPEPRYSHSATVVGPMLFIVGGLARKGRPHDDVHVLDLSTSIWSMPRVTHEGPAPRGRHTTTAVGSVLFLFGGGAQGELYEDVWALDVDGKGMGKLKTLAARSASTADAAAASEKAIPMSFLVPQTLGATAGRAVDEGDYESVEAREADADEVRSWLTHLGLAQHAYTFVAHEIDLQVLLTLRDKDLVDMRIDDPMQRMRLLHGIEVLRARGDVAPVGQAPTERLFRGRYRLGADISFGGHSAVLAVDCKTDLKVAIKFVADMATYHRQVALHKQLKELPIARLADSYAASASAAAAQQDGVMPRHYGLPCLVLEYGECSLADDMSSGLLAPVALKAKFEGMLHCVLALHAKGFAHCALQPESFRMYSSGWRLATLDSVTRVGEATPTECPVCYAPPEMVTQLRRATPGRGAMSTAPASVAMDVWSLGVLLWQLFSQQPLVANESEALTMLPSLRTVQLSLGCVTDLQARHLVYKMLQKDPEQRLAPQKILSHGYLTGGLDTIEMDSTYLPLQKGQVFVRSLLQAITDGAAKPRGRKAH